jgi:hypothetical protein
MKVLFLLSTVYGSSIRKLYNNARSKPDRSISVTFSCCWLIYAMFIQKLGIGYRHQHIYTVKPRYNEPHYNEFPVITNYFCGPGHFPVDITLNKPQYNEFHYNEFFIITK